jgi:hypothetical protein
MGSRRITLLVYVGAFLIQASCAETGLVLAPNSHLESVGSEVAREDVSMCDEQARAILQTQGLQPTVPPLGGSSVGGASNDLVMATAFWRRMNVGRAYRQTVQQCLAQEGYQVLRWQ